MIYIVEGCTCSGKSTFAKNLAEVLDYHLVHYSIPDKNFTYFTDYRNRIISSKNVVLDRFFYSELVYQKAFDREVKISESEVEELEFMLSLKGCKIIFMNPSFDLIKERYEKRGDDHVTDFSLLYKVYSSYRNVIDNSLLPVVEIVD